MLAVDCVVSRAVSELVTRNLMTGTEDVLNVIRPVLIKKKLFASLFTSIHTMSNRNDI